jgi:CheY-like chemotaxis protein
MDHSYRQQPGNEVNGNTIDGGRGFSGGGGNQRRFGRGQFRGGYQNRPGMPPAAMGEKVEPVAANGDAARPIFAFIEDLFFVTKINETARKLNLKVEFVKTVDELLEKAGEEKPSLVIVDLNNANAKPLTIIPKLKSQFKKGTSILGFVSHVQGDLKLKAQEAGCDSVLPRSAFSANLPQLLRRHGAPEEEAEV